MVQRTKQAGLGQLFPASPSPEPCEQSLSHPRSEQSAVLPDDDLKKQAQVFCNFNLMTPLSSWVIVWGHFFIPGIVKMFLLV